MKDNKNTGTICFFLKSLLCYLALSLK